MNVIGLMGSPRKRGNTDILLDELLKAAQSNNHVIKKLLLFSYSIKPCAEIYACRKTGECSIKDDFNKILEDLFNADIIVLASPIFFYGLPSHLKALIDRCQSLWCAKYILKKAPPIKKERKGYFISIGATHGKYLFNGAKLTVKYFFDALDTVYSDDLLIRGVDEKGAITRHPTALQDAYILGQKI